MTAVKVMEYGSLQGEREFKNKLLFVAVLGFSYDCKHCRVGFTLLPFASIDESFARISNLMVLIF